MDLKGQGEIFESLIHMCRKGGPDCLNIRYSEIEDSMEVEIKEYVSPERVVYIKRCHDLAWVIDRIKEEQPYWARFLPPDAPSKPDERGE